MVPCSILVFVGKKWSLEKWTNCSLVLEKIRGMVVFELLFGKMWGVLMRLYVLLGWMLYIMQIEATPAVEFNARKKGKKSLKMKKRKRK